MNIQKIVKHSYIKKYFYVEQIYQNAALCKEILGYHKSDDIIYDDKNIIFELNDISYLDNYEKNELKNESNNLNKNYYKLSKMIDEIN